MGLTLVKAQENLDLWIKASEALATGQSYTIGGRSLTRSNADHVLKMIDFWQNQVDKLTNAAETGAKSGSGRVIRMVPRDL